MYHTDTISFSSKRGKLPSSIEIALSEHCGPKDIISPNEPVDEELRSKLGFRGPQNRWVSPLKLGIRGMIGLLLRKEWAFHYNHCTADLVKQRIGKGKFEEYTSFCVVRNPWDRAVSMYWWNKNREDGHAIDQSISFSDYIMNAPRELFTDQEIYTIDGEVVVDHVIKFEDLQNGLDSVTTKLNLPSLSLPRAKGGTRKTKEHYSIIYDDETKDFIATQCAFEIEKFGYEFDDQRA